MRKYSDNIFLLLIVIAILLTLFFNMSAVMPIFIIFGGYPEIRFLS